jgi:hypothetical protein
MLVAPSKSPPTLPVPLPANLPTTLDCRYVCPLCQAERPVRFHDPDAFAEAEPLPGKQRWAQEQAFREALADMAKLAEKALAVVSCPACQRRDPLSLRRALRQALRPVAALAPALFMGGVIATFSLVPAAGRLLPMVVGGLLIFAAAPLLVRRRLRQILAEADAATEFLPPAP